MSIIGIAAVAQNLAIGRDGKLPWHYSADLKFFKRTTIRNTVVMGYDTWSSIGKPLPKRLNIVMSRSKQLENQSNVIVLRSVEDAVILSRYINGDMFIIGGSATYLSFANEIKQWVVTEIPLEIEDADSFMPSDFLEDFVATDSQEIGDGLTVRTYQRFE